MSIKIQLNSEEALKRLIGGDNEVEVEIRNSIVQNFGKKYLKSIAETAFSKMNDVAYRAVRDMFEEKVGLVRSNKYGYGSTFVLKPEIQAEVEKVAEEVLKQAIAEASRNILENMDIETLLAKMVEKRITQAWNQEISQAVEDRLKKIREAL